MQENGQKPRRTEEKKNETRNLNIKNGGMEKNIIKKVDEYENK
jgi:hypothetical protein